MEIINFLQGELISRPRIEYQQFSDYLNQIIHKWSRTVAALGFCLVPVFFLLDYFTMPETQLQKFLLYRVTASLVALVLYLILRNTVPSRLSYIHGYILSFVVGGAISLMTIDLGGFDSSYYVGLILVIIAINLMLPWGPVHTSLNSLIVIIFYVACNLIYYSPFEANNLVNNMFFLLGSVIIIIAINKLRFDLISQEFHLRKELVEARDSLWSEMAIAKKIQTSLLPGETDMDTYQCAALMEPADEVGGDYYDILKTETGQEWVAIGDVSGHGVESGLIMMMAQMGIATILQKGKEEKPSIILSRLNRTLKANIDKLGSEVYMTILLLKLNSTQITVSGKHQDILLYHAKSQTIKTIETKGTWIGIADEIEHYVFDKSILVEKGDVILLFTDGVTEATNAAGEMYGQERLTETFKVHAFLPLKELLDIIKLEIESFQDTQEDDITLLALKKL